MRYKPWDVTFEYPLFRIRKTVRVLARADEDPNDIACDFFIWKHGPTLQAKKAGRRNRKIVAGGPRRQR